MLGSRIAALRRQRALSQQELANRLGVSPSAIGMYEQGRREPPLDTVVALAALFGVSTDYLLTGESCLPGDLEKLKELYLLARTGLDGRLFLRHADGTQTPVSDEDLALLLAAILG